MYHNLLRPKFVKIKKNAYKQKQDVVKINYAQSRNYASSRDGLRSIHHNPLALSYDLHHLDKFTGNNKDRADVMSNSVMILNSASSNHSR